MHRETQAGIEKTTSGRERDDLTSVDTSRECVLERALVDVGKASHGRHGVVTRAPHPEGLRDLLVGILDAVPTSRCSWRPLSWFDGLEQPAGVDASLRDEVPLGAVMPMCLVHQDRADRPVGDPVALSKGSPGVRADPDRVNLLGRQLTWSPESLMLGVEDVDLVGGLNEVVRVDTPLVVAGARDIHTRPRDPLGEYVGYPVGADVVTPEIHTAVFPRHRANPPPATAIQYLHALHESFKFSRSHFCAPSLPQ